MIVLHVIAGSQPVAALAKIKLLAAQHPGEHALTLRIQTSYDLRHGEQGRRLALGSAWRYDGSAACLAALREFGDVEIAAP